MIPRLPAQIARLRWGINLRSVDTIHAELQAGTAKCEQPGDSLVLAAC